MNPMQICALLWHALPDGSDTALVRWEQINSHMTPFVVFSKLVCLHSMLCIKERGKPSVCTPIRVLCAFDPGQWRCTRPCQLLADSTLGLCDRIGEEARLAQGQRLLE